MNSVQLIGVIVTDIRVLAVGPKQAQMIALSLRVNRGYKNKAGIQEYDYIQIRSFDSQGEYIKKYYQRGDVLAIKGQLRVIRKKTDDGKVYINSFVQVEAVCFSGYSYAKIHRIYGLGVKKVLETGEKAAEKAAAATPPPPPSPTQEDEADLGNIDW